jgi:[protein-PII] uridylyltransferase
MSYSTDPVAQTYRTDCTAINLARARTELRSCTPDQLDSAALREAWRRLHETWLTAKAAEIGVAAASGFAIVATGSLGRDELLPCSDLDLLLLHDDMPVETVERVAELLWYPLWDANVRLDHSVRTVAEALEVAAANILADLGLLDARHIVGDERLSVQLRDGVRREWRYGIHSRYDELVETAQSRWQRCGEIAHAVEPDVKSGRGGLRDVQLLAALSLGHLTDGVTAGGPGDQRDALSGAHRTLLDVRTEIHRSSGRGDDLLTARDADAISVALRFGDSGDLVRRLSAAADTVSCRVDAVFEAAGV